MSDETIPEELRDVIKGAIHGIHSFIETEVVPLEEQYKEILGDERKLFGDDGLLVPEIREARAGIRRKSAQAGYYAMLAPESIGGGGLPFTAAPFVVESLYRKHGPGRIFVGWAAGFLSTPILASLVDGPSHLFTGAGEAVRSEVLPALLAGEETACFAATEADAGSDLWGLRCKARRDGDDWVINGAKQWITNAPYADYAVIFAITDEGAFNAHKGGMTCFLIDVRAAGVGVGKPLPIMGHVSSDCGGFTFEDVRIRHDYVIGAVDRAFEIAMSGISEGRLGIAAGCLGLAEWALDRALEYSQERRTFGVPLADHQAIQFMIADSAMEIYATKYMVVQTAKLVDALPSTGRVPVKEICMAKAYSVEMAQRVLDRAIQIHGAMGLSGEMALEEGFRIARTLRIPDGTSEIQRRTIFRQLQRGDTVF